MDNLGKFKVLVENETKWLSELQKKMGKFGLSTDSVIILLNHVRTVKKFTNNSNLLVYSYML